MSKYFTRYTFLAYALGLFLSFSILQAAELTLPHILEEQQRQINELEDKLWRFELELDDYGRNGMAREPYLPLTPSPLLEDCINCMEM